MTGLVSIDRRTTFALLTAGARRRVSKAAAATTAWVAAERHAFFSRSAAGAFHGEAPPGGGYLTQMRSTWGRP